MRVKRKDDTCGTETRNVPHPYRGPSPDNARIVRIMVEEVLCEGGRNGVGIAPTSKKRTNIKSANTTPSSIKNCPSVTETVNLTRNNTKTLIAKEIDDKDEKVGGGGKAFPINPQGALGANLSIRT